MSDPAVEAAQRAICKRYGGPVFQPGERDLNVAREALAPIRDLHRKVSKRNGWSGHYEDVCLHCQNDNVWPCDTARLIYPSEDL
jgi:hypothetical protein